MTQAAFLATQSGLITRSQALSELSLSALRHLLASRWTMVLPGVYAGSREPLNRVQRQRAGLLYAGSSAQLADVTSLLAHGMRDVPTDDVVHLLIPATEHRANKAFVSVRRTHRLPSPVTIGELPYCPPERALVDAAARLGDQQTARALIADAVQRRIASTAGLMAEVPHLAGRGSGVARRAVQDIMAGARSAPECEFLDLCRTVRGLPLPLPNPLIQLSDGRTISPDALWTAARLIHETNSRQWHADEDRFESTQERADALTAAAFIVLSNSPRQIRQDAERIKRQVAALYRENVGRGLPSGVVVLHEGPR